MRTEPTPLPPKEEPEKIKKWREEQKARLEEKGNESGRFYRRNGIFLKNDTDKSANFFSDAEEEKKKEEWKEAAKKELEEWYKHHAEAINKTKATNR